MALGIWQACECRISSFHCDIVNENKKPQNRRPFILFGFNLIDFCLTAVCGMSAFASCIVLIANFSELNSYKRFSFALMSVAPAEFSDVVQQIVFHARRDLLASAIAGSVLTASLIVLAFAALRVRRRTVAAQAKD
jgi:hypothetical protein